MKIGMKILMINNKDVQCGVADYGQRVHDILCPHFNIFLAAVKDLEEYKNAAAIFTPGDIILYNYHYATLPFITDEVIDRRVKHIAIFHEAHLNFTPDATIDTWVRPLFEDIEFEKNESSYVLKQSQHTDIGYNPSGDSIIEHIPTIGSFGFGFPDKNYSRIAELVKEQFTEATIRINIPFAEYGDKDGYLAKREADKVRTILEGTNIKAEITHDYLNQTDLLKFLRANDINLFLYNQSHGRGLSSAIDYALSVYKPIGVSGSEMFRHLPKELNVDKTSLKDLMKNWFEILQPVYEQNSNKKLIEKYKVYLQ